MCDIVYTINVHEKPDFLLYQIKNIEKYTQASYYIILNCNKFMYESLSSNNNIKQNNKIIINKEYFEKKRFTGLLFKGIYKNLQLSLKKFKFKYFIILSSRNLFYNLLTVEKIDELFKSFYKNQDNIKITNYNNLNNWGHWNKIKKLKVSKLLKSKNANFKHSAHEGLVIKYKTCKSINSFFFNKNDMLIELFNSKTVAEEFIIQTLALLNKDGYINIGRWTAGNHDIKNKKNWDINKFLYKTKRELIEIFSNNYKNNKNSKNKKIYYLNLILILIIVFIILFLITLKFKV